MTNPPVHGNPAGPVEAQARQTANPISDVPRFTPSDPVREFASILTAHYAELAAFARDLLTGVKP